MTTDGKEVEVKIRLDSSTAVSERLRASGFHESVSRLFEANTLYDTKDHTLRNDEMLLRLREIAPKRVITWKGRGDPGPYKSRTELETTVGSIEVLGQILERLGLAPWFRYEKYRTEFVQESAVGTVTLDETPIGDFLELEGPGEWIDETARQLGFSRQDYVLESYGRLYLADCARRGVEPTNMVFASNPR